MKKIIMLFIVSTFGLTGCTTAREIGYSTARTIANEPISAPAIATPNPKLMVFGGKDHTVYLGCLNCSQYASDSIHNRYSSYGSAYSSTSIFNKYGSYGSAYSADGVCSKYATDPPVIVDSNGNYYGRLTLNPHTTGLGIGAQYIAWLSGVCQH